MLENLKYASLVAGVQHHIFCPGCRDVMDVRRTVEVTLENEGKILGVTYVCIKCYDQGPGPARIKENMTAKGIDFTDIEILDGRDADWETIEMMGVFS